MAVVPESCRAFFLIGIGKSVFGLPQKLRYAVYVPSVHHDLDFRTGSMHASPPRS